MVSIRFLSLAVCVVLLGAAIFPPEVVAHGYKRYLIAYLVAKALKPRFVPVPLPLPFPIKFTKKSHVSYPVHTKSHSAHAEFVDFGHGGGYGGGHGGGYGGGHGFDLGGYGGDMGGYGGDMGGYGGDLGGGHY